MEEVENSFYVHFLYEMLNFVMKKYEKGGSAAAASAADAEGAAAANHESLLSEVEQLGGELGKRACDKLAIGCKEKHNNQIEKTRFLCVVVWPYLFNYRVTTLKSNGQGAYHIIDNNNEFLARLSSDDPESPEFLHKVSVYKAFLQGIIKGVLYNLGGEGPIKCELKLMPQENSAYMRLVVLLNYMEKRKVKD